MSNPIPKKLQLEVMDRDGGICQKCGGRGAHIHHIVYGGTGRKRIHRIENLITLCLDCHDGDEGVHRNREAREWSYRWSRARYGGVVDELIRQKWSDAV